MPFTEQEIAAFSAVLMAEPTIRAMARVYHERTDCGDQGEWDSLDESTRESVCAGVEAALMRLVDILREA